MQNSKLKKINIYIKDKLNKEESDNLYKILTQGQTFQFNVLNWIENTPTNTQINDDIYNADPDNITIKQYCDTCKKELKPGSEEKTHIEFPTNMILPHTFEKLCPGCGFFIYKLCKMLKEDMFPNGR